MVAILSQAQCDIQYKSSPWEVIMVLPGLEVVDPLAPVGGGCMCDGGPTLARGERAPLT